MSSTIDNTWSNTMANALRAFLPATERIDILVGYFYFSGFKEVYKDLSDKKIRILVGMDMDEKLIPLLARKQPHNLYEMRTSEKEPSLSAEEDKYFRVLSWIFNDTNWFEDPESLSAFKVFISKIEDGTLEIKKSLKSNHSKRYLFHFKESESKGWYDPWKVIMWSSNLSYSWLVSREEDNVILHERAYYDDYSKKFEIQWEDSENITIVDIKTKDIFLDRIKNTLWLYQKPSPFHLYVRILKELFTINIAESDIKTPKQATGWKFSDFRYQLDAIRFGIDSIQKYNGVIIADVVGLWKSIIASGIAHNICKKTIIICPPHLTEQWNGYKTEFHINATVFTTGKIEEALKHKEQHWQDGKEWLIVIDEAHKFRNEDTENYQLLHRLCTNSNVLILTATPFNNDPKDLFALVKLFDTPGLSKIQTVENLSIEFRILFSTYKKLRKSLRKNQWDIQIIKKKGEEIASRLRQLVSPVMLRRSRSDLQNIEVYQKDLERQGISFAHVHDPRLQTYSLGEISERYMLTLERLSPAVDEDEEDMEDDLPDWHDIESEETEGMIGARYKTISYLKEDSKTFQDLQKEEMLDEEILSDETKVSAKKKQQQIGQAQTNVAKFMRRLLVRRFESSLPAFRSTLESILSQSKNMKSMIEKQGIVIVMKKWEIKTEEELADMIEGEREEYFKTLDEKGAIRIKSEEFKPTLLQDLNEDIELLEEIWNWWFGDGVVQTDPKFDSLNELLAEKLTEDKNRKIIIFSEFADTAQAVYESLRASGYRVMKYSSIDADVDKKEEIRRNFDAGYKVEDQKNDYDVLVATDAISEWYNLHRAGIIINYDIPFNPTRVIQRIGRINRVNKKVFEDLYIYNFFPTTIGEKETQTKGISTLKMHMIHALLWDDAKTLTSDEELKSYFIQEYRKAEAQSEWTDEWGWQKEFRNDWENIKDDEETMRIVNQIAHRVRIGRNGSSLFPAISFARRWDTPLFGVIGDDGIPALLGPEKLLPLFRAEKGEEGHEVTERFEPLYQSLRDKLFQNNTDPEYEGRRKGAIERIDVLRVKIPEYDTYLRDIKKLIEFDALPEWTYKELASISWKIDDAKDTLEKILPKHYVSEKLKSIAEDETSDHIIYLSEQFLW
jgi:superfamily II DNA or RNA helicase